MRALGGGNEGCDRSVTFANFIKIQKNMICRTPSMIRIWLVRVSECVSERENE